MTDNTLNKFNLNNPHDTNFNRKKSVIFKELIDEDEKNDGLQFKQKRTGSLFLQLSDLRENQRKGKIFKIFCILAGYIFRAFVFTETEE